MVTASLLNRESEFEFKFACFLHRDFFMVYLSAYAAIAFTAERQYNAQEVTLSFLTCYDHKNAKILS